MDVLILQFEALLMSFGGTMLDDYDSPSLFPCRSMLAGLIGNAMGFTFSEVEALSEIQDRLRYAVRRDREGEVYEDFQTVDVTQPHMQGARITSHGWSIARGGSHYRTLVRRRCYISGGRCLVALTLTGEDGQVSIQDVAAALKSPARVLFIGRKTCLPSCPIFMDRVQADSVSEALQAVPLADKDRVHARWPSDEGPEGRVITLVEDRDWANGIHVGERRMKEGYLEVASCP